MATLCEVILKLPFPQHSTQLSSNRTHSVQVLTFIFMLATWPKLDHLCTASVITFTCQSTIMRDQSMTAVDQQVINLTDGKHKTVMLDNSCIQLFLCVDFTLFNFRRSTSFKNNDCHSNYFTKIIRLTFVANLSYSNSAMFPNYYKRWSILTKHLIYPTTIHVPRNTLRADHFDWSSI